MKVACTNAQKSASRCASGMRAIDAIASRCVSCMRAIDAIAPEPAPGAASVTSLLTVFWFVRRTPTTTARRNPRAGHAHNNSRGTRAKPRSGAVRATPPRHLAARIPYSITGPRGELYGLLRALRARTHKHTHRRAPRLRASPRPARGAQHTRAATAPSCSAGGPAWTSRPSQTRGRSATPGPARPASPRDAPPPPTPPPPPPPPRAHASARGAAPVAAGCPPRPRPSRAAPTRGPLALARRGTGAPSRATRGARPRLPRARAPDASSADSDASSASFVSISAMDVSRSSS